jgi:hypothetical protein
MGIRISSPDFSGLWSWLLAKNQLTAMINSSTLASWRTARKQLKILGGKVTQVIKITKFCFRGRNPAKLIGSLFVCLLVYCLNKTYNINKQ